MKKLSSNTNRQELVVFRECRLQFYDNADVTSVTPERADDIGEV